MLESTAKGNVSVVAIIAAHNEADILESVIRDLVDQGVQVYFIDDASTDGTLAIAERWLGRGVIGAESAASQDGAGPGAFDWERLLVRKAQLARELHADWFIHHDADEFRESPWPDLSLQAAIARVDALGFNAIDSVRLDFWPISDNFRPGDDIREVLTCYAPPARYDRMQIRCWKRTDALVDLASTGGHEVRFEGRRVFPHRFILKHYPIRGQAHGERKIFAERRPRFTAQERARGWHVQYDDAVQGQSFIRDPATLAVYDAHALRLALALTRGTSDELADSLGASLAELQAARLDLEETGAALAHVRASLTDARRELGGARHLIEQLRMDSERLEAQLADAANQIGTLHASLDERRREAAAANLSIAQVSEQLRQIQHSLSWRWTEPARRVFGMLGRFR